MAAPEGERYTFVEAKVDGEIILTVGDTVGDISASVAPARGGELCSLKIGGVELLYHGGEYKELEASDWQGKGPNLFPAVGRNFTKEQLEETKDAAGPPAVGSYTVGGETRAMTTHGFAMNVPWKSGGGSVDGTGAHARCELEAATLSDEVRKMYPWNFKMTFEYTVFEGKLSVKATVQSLEAADTMYCSIGNHITLKYPFAGEAAWGTGVVRGSPSVECKLTNRSLMSGDTVDRSALGGDGVSLSDASICDTVLGGMPEGKAWLSLSQPGKFGVKVSQSVAPPEGLRDREWGSDLFFVCWGSSEGGFFCPEPWLGGPDSLNSGKGRVDLAPGASFDWTYTVERVDA